MMSNPLVPIAIIILIVLIPVAIIASILYGLLYFIIKFLDVLEAYFKCFVDILEK